MKDNGTFQLFIEVLPRKCSGLAQYFAIAAVLARTRFSDAHPTPEWAKIPTVELGAIAGMTSKAFDFAIEEAVERGLLAKEYTGRNALLKALPENWLTVADFPRSKRPMNGRRKIAA